MICYGCRGTIESGADVYRAPINATVGGAVFHADCWAEWNAEGESVITDRKSFIEANEIDQNRERGAVLREVADLLADIQSATQIHAPGCGYLINAYAGITYCNCRVSRLMRNLQIVRHVTAKERAELKRTGNGDSYE